MTPEHELSLAKAKALHKSAVAGKTVREAEGDFGSAIGTADDLLIVAFALTAEGAEQGRNAVLAALAFASESSAPQLPVDEDEVARLQSCEKAWRAVWEALKLADPAMDSRSSIGRECAVKSIQRLQALADALEGVIGERDAARAELSLVKAKAISLFREGIADIVYSVLCSAGPLESRNQLCIDLTNAVTNSEGPQP
jgi:hypothetical protein